MKKRRIPRKMKKEAKKLIRLISPVAYDRPPQYDRTTACFCGFQKVAYVVKPEKKPNRQTQKCIAACYREERASARRMEELFYASFHED